MPNLLDLLSQAGMALDTPGAMFRNTLAGRSPLHGIVGDGERTSGRDLLEQYGLLGANEDGLDWGDAAGLGVEMIADPLNLIGTGLLTKALHGKRLAAANRAARAEALANNASRAEVLAAGGIPQEVMAESLARDGFGNPIAYYHGTPHAFDQIDLSKANPKSLRGPGHYMTADPGVGSSYTTKGAVLEPKTRWEIIDGAEDAVAQAGTKYNRGMAGMSDVYATMSRAEARELLDREVMGDFRMLAGWAPDRPLYGAHKEFFDAVLPNVRRIEVPISPQNVRKSYLDMRNPFDTDLTLGEEKLARLKALYEEGGEAAARLKGGTGFSSPYPEQNPFSRLDRVNYSDLPGELLWSDLVNHFGPEATNQFLRDAGHDFITHMGGVATNSPLHPVAIALDPSRVYSPFVAPRAWPVPAPLRPPAVSASPLVAALGAHNAAARGVPRFME